MNNEKLTILYERLSHEDGRENESLSIENQKAYLEEYALRSGFKNLVHRTDDGWSGTRWDRPGFLQMTEDISRGSVGQILIKDMSRLGRDHLRVGLFLEQLREMNVRLIAVAEGIDTAKGEDDFMPFRNILAEWHARDTSRKIRAIFGARTAAGNHVTGALPYGYLHDPKDRQKWIVDEEAAAIVQKVFSLCIDGLGPTQIARWLKEHEILCPSAYWKSKGIKTPTKPPKNPYGWTTETVSFMLERVEYLGHTVNFKTTKQSYKSKKILRNDPENWAIFENTQPPIIEESVFLIVQNIRKSRRRPTRMGDMGMFSGLLFCADCGNKMYQCRTNEKPGNAYFLCATYRKDRSLCTTHSIRNVILHEIVLNNLREAIQYVTEHEAEFIQEAADHSLRDRDAEFARKREAYAKAEQRIAELDRIISRLYEDNVMGKLSDERFVKMSHDYELEQSNLKSMADVLRKELKQQEQQKTNVKAFIAVVKKYTDMRELDATLLREFIDRIEVSQADRATKRQSITIVYNFIGAFDFSRAIEEARNTTKKQQRTA